MVYLLFFYDMVVTMVSLAFCVAFAGLFVRRKNLLHLWLSLLFGFCTLDIVLMYLLDFVPEFRTVFHSSGAANPLLYVYVHFCILFCCRWVIGSCFGRSPHITEAPFWIFLVVVVTASAALSPDFVFSPIKDLCIGAMQVYIVCVAARGMREGTRKNRVLSVNWLRALIATFALCSVGYLVYACLAYLAGLFPPRNPFVDLSGGAYLVFACVYLIAYYRQEHQVTLESVVSEAAERYELTRREAEILLMLAEGRGNQEIGSLLFISLGTVKTHVHNIYVKLGINRRSELHALLKEQSAGTPRAAYFDQR